ncbi:MAG: hypothetical protein KAS18_06175 [Calditrichia bacterium]|nr:hypothetical protein [Calditrichia bacterium]
MLLKLIDRLKGIRTTDPINVNKFSDSVAQKTSWGPLKKGGASFGTHKLVGVSQRRLEFKPTVFAVIFYLIFTVLGFGLLSSGLYNEFQTSFELDNITLLIVGTVFFVVGIILGYSGTKPIVFDREFGFYWKGRKKPNRDIEYSHPELFTPLNDIHALQILSEYIKGNKSSYYSYELNLVFRDGSRANVIDHGNLEKIREDAKQVSQFINRPVWDSVI